MGTPRQLTEEEVKSAAEGKSAEIMGEKRPVDLTEDEVKAASQGKSGDVMAAKVRQRKSK